MSTFLNTKILCKSALISGASLLLIACGGNAPETESTADIAAEVPAAISDSELAARRTATGLREQGERMVGEAEAQAERLQAAGETIKTSTSQNVERLKSEAALPIEAGEAMNEAAKQEAAALKADADRIVETAKDKAKAMEDTADAMVKDVKAPE